MNKMSRKILALLLALVMTVSLCPTSVFAVADTETSDSVTTEVTVVDEATETDEDKTIAETDEAIETDEDEAIADTDEVEDDIATAELVGEPTVVDESDDSTDDSSTTTEQGDIGEELYGDYAYLSDVAMVEDSTTTSGYAMRTGTSPWDDDDTAGNDSTDLNNSLRTYDIATYTVTFTSRVRDDAPYKFYYQGNLYFEFILQGDSSEVQFETGSMGWLDAKNATYTVSEETIDGEVCQVLRGYYSWQPASGNDHAIGESTQELTLAIRALAMSNGDTIQPTFTFWLEGNEVGVDYKNWGTEDYTGGVVTGSNATCSDHSETEYQTITAPSISVSAVASYNIVVTASSESTTGTFDFSTGTDSALNKSAGSVTGRLASYGITIQIVGKSATEGLRGIELPKSGEDITFTLTLSSSAQYDDTTKDTTETFTPLVWSLEGNSSSASQTDDRSLPSELNRKYALYAPFNKNTSGAYNSCYDGGTWTGTQTDNTVSITISDWQLEMSLDVLPYSYASGSTLSTTYYDSSSVSNYWEIQYACISGGELWVVQPFYTTDGEYILDYLDTDDMSFTTTVKDSNLSMQDDLGNTITEQAVTTDDTATQDMALVRPGTIVQSIAYQKYNRSAWNDPVTEGCWQTPKDWILAGNQLAIFDWISNESAEGEYTAVAYDELVKFDDAFFEPDGTTTATTLNSSVLAVKPTILYGAKADKSGWSHTDSEGNELSPGDDGYDTEMINATTDDLVYFTSLTALEEAGYTCVAVLVEWRGLASTSYNHTDVTIKGTAKTTAETDCVYMVTHYGRSWNRSDLATACAESGNENYASYTADDIVNMSADEIKTLVDELIPSRASTAVDKGYSADDAPSYDTNYPSSCYWINGGSDGTTSQSNLIRNYTKAAYDENGYVSGATSGVYYGDSCLLVGYVTGVTLNVAQLTTGGAEKAAYDMDTSQRIVDYALQATITRNDGEGESEDQSQTTEITMAVTIPAGLTYLEGTSYIGGTYTTNGEGVQGTVTGGTLLEENKTVTVYDEDGNALYTVFLSLESNENGTTTLTYTLTGVTLSSEELQYLDIIHFSCEIGTEGNEETDVSNGDSLTVSATVESTEDCNRDFTTANGNYSECGILVSKNSASALSKFADQSVVEVGGTMGFTLNVANNSTNAVTVRAVEGLPYSDDGVSSFDGDLVVTEFRVYSSASADENGDYTYDADEFAARYPDIKFYYTTNTEYRGKYSEDLQNENFTNTDNWTELTIGEDGTATLPDNFKPVAIVAVGTLPASTTLRMHISVTLPDGQGGDYVVNRLSNYNTTSLTSSARCRIISRALEGLAWYDANADGIQNGGTGLNGAETVVNGVKVELLKLKDGGDASNEADYELVATTTTGHQYDVSSKTESDYTEGYYYFTSLSAGTYAVRFTEGTYSFTDMSATLVNQGSDDTIDSDAVATYEDEDGSLTKTVITNIAMPDVSTLTYGSYVDRHHDSGFYCAKEFAAEDIVIDFGLPVDHSITGWDDSVSSLTGSATYGDVIVSGSTAKGWTVTYTPTKVLTGIDTVTLTDGNSIEYTFKVYPATTVYYEEGFATYGTGWSVDTSSTSGWSGQLDVSYSTKQETEIANTAGNSYNNYNYDEAYIGNTAASNGTVATGTTKGDSLSFSFTGTGVDIFATGTSETGTVHILIRNSSDVSVKMLTVDTSDIGSYNSGDVAYNTPIASVSDLTYGEYTVIIYASTPDSGFIFDGFRVYDTCKNDTDANAVYTTDLEDNPSYYELRNNVLAGLNVSTGSEKTIYASDIAKTTLAQVYATGTDNTSGAVVYYANSEGNSLLQRDTDVQDLLDDGPKNELYLYPGMTVIFTINTSREVQIGLRSVTGAEVSYSINNTSSSISSSVDMFYTLQSSGTGNVTYTITVPSDSTGILSITDIKACDCTDETVFGELTESDLTAALVSMGYAADETTADAALTVNLVDYAGSVIASNELTENGTEGESATYAASDILAAVTEALPDGYALVDEDSIADQTVTYGESGSVNIQIGKVATLTVTYQKYSGLLKKTTVGTATLTKVQTSSTSKATFSASEIKSAVPSGYKVLLATSSSVNYGSAGTKTVTVY